MRDVLACLLRLPVSMTAKEMQLAPFETTCLRTIASLHDVLSFASLDCLLRLPVSMPAKEM